MGLIRYTQLLKPLGIQTWNVFPLGETVLQARVLEGDSQHAVPCFVSLADSPPAAMSYNNWFWLLLLLVRGGSYIFPNAWSVIACYFITSFAYLLFWQRGRPGAHCMVCTAPSQQGARAGYPATAVCAEGVIWKGGGFSVWWKEAEEECLLTTPDEIWSSAETCFSWFVKGVPAQAAELKCCVRCDLTDGLSGCGCSALPS